MDCVNNIGEKQTLHSYSAATVYPRQSYHWIAYSTEKKLFGKWKLQTKFCGKNALDI